jgi:hypothetical protein
LPKGKRHIVTINGIKYDISPGQFEILSKKVFRMKTISPWQEEQRIKGLVDKNFFVKAEITTKSRSYKRTKLGEEVYKALLSRS